MVDASEIALSFDGSTQVLGYAGSETLQENPGSKRSRWPPSKPETSYASLLGTLNNYPWTLTSLTIKQPDIPLGMFGVCKRSNGWALGGGGVL